VTTPFRDRGRRGAALIALAVAAFVCMATGSDGPRTLITSGAVTGTLTVDTDHPIATQEFTVKVNDAAAGVAADGASVEVSGNVPSTVRLTVVPILVDLYGQAAPSADPDSWGGRYWGGSHGAQEVSSDWPAALPVDCQAPCERAFRVVLQQAAATAPVSVTWKAVASLEYTGDVWPSGAAIDIQASSPVLVSTGRGLAAEIPDQEVILDETRPAAMRVVEVRLSAVAVPQQMGDVVTIAVLEANAPGEDPFDVPYSLTLRDVSSRSLVGVYLPGLSQFDPFSDCQPGLDCVRRFVVTARWLNGPAVKVHWNMHISQLRLRGSPVAPGDLSMQVVGSYDIAGDPPSRLHYEGDLQVTPSPDGSGSASIYIPVAVQPDADNPTGPWADSPLPLYVVPAPIVGRLSASVTSGSVRSRGDISVIATTNDGWLASWFGDSGPGVGAPSEDAHSTSSLPLVFKIEADLYGDVVAASPITIHWTFDLDLYQYKGLPPMTLVRGP
jgi:hypothetical protein